MPHYSAVHRAKSGHQHKGKMDVYRQSGIQQADYSSDSNWKMLVRDIVLRSSVTSELTSEFII